MIAALAVGAAFIGAGIVGLAVAWMHAREGEADWARQERAWRRSGGDIHTALARTADRVSAGQTPIGPISRQDRRRAVHPRSR